MYACMLNHACCLNYAKSFGSSGDACHLKLLHAHTSPITAQTAVCVKMMQKCENVRKVAKRSLMAHRCEWECMGCSNSAVASASACCGLVYVRHGPCKSIGCSPQSQGALAEHSDMFLQPHTAAWFSMTADLSCRLTWKQ